jgi:predicted negative regulator of RcsB-dependent stress response
MGLLTWVEVNKRRLLIGGVAVLVVLFLVIVVIQQQIHKEVQASRDLSDIKMPFSAGGAVPPGTPEALLKFARDHKGTQAAARALLVSAGLAFSDPAAGGYAEAQKRFAELLREYPSSPWTAEANLGIAKCLLADGKTNEATAKFEDLRNRFTKAGIAEEVKLDLARLYEGTKPEESFRIYDELLKTGMGGALAMEASMRQEDLLKQRPELAKLREPIAPPAPPNMPANTLQMALSNRMSAVTGSTAGATSTVQRITLTNRLGTTGQAPSIKLSPVPAAGTPAQPPASPAPGTPPAAPATK